VDLAVLIEHRSACCRYFVEFSSSVASVGPGGPTGSRLGPERRNTFSGAVDVGNRTPMKQLLISSQFCGPQTIFFVGSGLNRFAGELSKCVMNCSLEPFGSAIGSAYC